MSNSRGRDLHKQYFQEVASAWFSTRLLHGRAIPPLRPHINAGTATHRQSMWTCLTAESNQRDSNLMAYQEMGAEDPFIIDEDLVQSPQHKTALTGELDFDGLLQPSLVLHQDLANGNGGQAWPAGMVLATYLLRRKRDELHHSTILELGAGGGLVGLAVALGCRPHAAVRITDQESMLALMQRNITLNQAEGKIEASVYNWGSDSYPPVSVHPDVILAADCVYFEPAFPLLQQSLEALIGPNTICYFCFKKRRRADLRFMSAVNKRFAVEPVDDDPDRDMYGRNNIFLYTIRRKEHR